MVFIDINSFRPKTGRIIGEDRQVYNIVDIAAGNVKPVPGLMVDIESYKPHTGRIIAEDGSVFNIVDLLRASTISPGGNYDKVVVFSATRPAGNWDLWLQDLGEINDYPDEDEDVAVILTTAPIDAPGDFALENDTGEGETILNMTDDEQSAGDNDIIPTEQ